MIMFFGCAYLVSSARSQETCLHDKLNFKMDELAARWQATYREVQVRLKPKIGGKMNIKGVVI